MVSGRVQRDSGVTLVGGGEVSAEDIETALKFAPSLVAADGGANRALALGFRPEATIGDFDSLTEASRGALAQDSLVHDADQDTTDFQKCLMRISAPHLIAVGFDGGRLDHTLAVCAVLAQRPGPPTVVLGRNDLFFAAGEAFRANLEPGTRVSLFPLGATRGTSRGLKWPIDDLVLDPHGRLGTSNEATGDVELTFERAGTLIILPRHALAAVVTALTTG